MKGSNDWFLSIEQQINNYNLGPSHRTLFKKSMDVQYNSPRPLYDWKSEELIKLATNGIKRSWPSIELPSLALLELTKRHRTSDCNYLNGLFKSKNILPEKICVVLDDVDLPLGKIRIKPKGGDGSHRGLENIIYVSNTDNIPRLRFGIGTSEKMRPAENYVLKPFKKDNDKTLSRETVKNAANALDSLVFNGINRTMNIYNS